MQVNLNSTNNNKIIQFTLLFIQHIHGHRLSIHLRYYHSSLVSLFLLFCLGIFVCLGFYLFRLEIAWIVFDLVKVFIMIFHIE